MTAKDGTASRWVKALRGLLAVATFNALNSLINGHLTNLPSKPISHTDALLMTLLFLGSTVVSAVAFKGRSLNLVDKLAVLGFVFCAAWGMVESDISIENTALAVGFCCLLFAWAFDRIKRRGHSSGSRPESHVAVH